MDSTRLASHESSAPRDATKRLRFDAPDDAQPRPWFWQLIHREPPAGGEENTPRN